MNLYSEFTNGNRKAVIEKDSQLNRSTLMSRWYVTMYIEGRTIQKTATLSEVEAKTLAEDFIHMGSFGGPTLLNESNNNG